MIVLFSELSDMKKIIQKFGPTIRYHIWRLTGVYDPDLEQEVYLRLWQKQDLYAEEGKQKAYIKTVTTNLCRDYKRTNAYKMRTDEISTKTLSETLSEIPDETPLLEETTDLKQRQKIVLTAVKKLPLPLKKVIILSHFEELKEQEIALRLRVPVGTVKSRLHTARNILKQQLLTLKGK